LLRALAAVALASSGAVSVSTPASAECPYIPPYPAVTEAAKSAREIIVGTVLENIGGQIYDFRLRVDHVLRGSSAPGEIRGIKFLYPKWPLDRATDGRLIAPCEAIAASPGNVIALAFDALAPDGKTRYNAVSWLSGTPEFRSEPGQYEVTTLSVLVALASLPATDAGPVRSEAPPSRGMAALDVAVLAIGISTALFLHRRLGRQSPARRRSDDGAAR
jgi:hypothetical protein